MAKYILKSDEFTEIAESSGTLVNISNVPVEVSESPEFGTGIILFPRQHFPFNKGIYAVRAPSGFGTAVVGTIGTGGIENFEDGDVGKVFDEYSDTGAFTGSDVDEVFNDSNSIATGDFTQDDVNSIFDD